MHYSLWGQWNNDPSDTITLFIRWLVGLYADLSVGPHDEIIESAYVEIWLRRNCFALAPGLDYPC
jgi:hypothetical protein